MITTLRARLLIVVLPTLAIMAGLGLWAIAMFWRLGNNIDLILRENYRSVRAAQEMAEATGTLESARYLALAGSEGAARRLDAEGRRRFAAGLEAERRNVTLPGEQEMADDLDRLYAAYGAELDAFYTLAPGDRRASEAAGERTTVAAIRRRAGEILAANQRNMVEEKDRSRRMAESSTRWMLLGLVGASAVAAGLAAWAGRSLLGPIRELTTAARGMAEGRLDQVVPASGPAELGELAGAFNRMATTIRAFREAGTARLVRAQQAAQSTIDSLPDPVIVVDTSGAVERANPAARRVLGVGPAEGRPVFWAPPGPLGEAMAEILSGRVDRLQPNLDAALAYRDEGQERFYLPHVLAIRDERGDLLGAAVVMADVTRFRLLDELKTDMVSTVSHELKTPLTGVQMTVHLLLEEVVGPLNAKQVELLLAARQDSDRLLAIIEDLLDLTRIEQGRVRLDRRPESPAGLIDGAIGRSGPRARDLGVDLKGEADPALPAVAVDLERVEHVFDNLVGNALSHTPRGGSVVVVASAEPATDGGAGGSIRFEVSDTGGGIAAEHLGRIFEKFYRVPGSKSNGGAGLGLAIAREIVAAHGGRIAAEGRPGGGTTFAFTLPIEPAVAAGGDQR